MPSENSDSPTKHCSNCFSNSTAQEGNSADHHRLRSEFCHPCCSKRARLDLLQRHFTPADLAFIKGKIVTPVVGAPWLKPYYGCQQTKRARVGNIIIRIRGNWRYPKRVVVYQADWAPIDNPTHFQNYVPSFNQTFEAI